MKSKQNFVNFVKKKKDIVQAIGKFIWHKIYSSLRYTTSILKLFSYEACIVISVLHQAYRYGRPTNNELM